MSNTLPCVDVHYLDIAIIFAMFVIAGKQHISTIAHAFCDKITSHYAPFKTNIFFVELVVCPTAVNVASAPLPKLTVDVNAVV